METYEKEHLSFVESTAAECTLFRKADKTEHFKGIRNDKGASSGKLSSPKSFEKI